MQRFSAQHPMSSRLRRMAALGTALVHLLEGRVEPGLQMARDIAADAALPEFDMEAATNVLSLWSRLQPHGISEPDYRSLVQQLARRFAVSKVATEVLVAAVRREEEASRWVREAYSEVMLLAEQAMNHAVQGQPKAAVETLLHHGQNTGNAKLIEMAGLVAQRHRERIDDVDRLIGSAGTLAHRYCMPATHIAGVRRSNRSAGGLVLRR
jgi:hypothetical protein